MSTWQIFSDTDNNFRWKVSDQQLHIKLQDEEPGGALIPPPNSVTSLPSMADLLIQGCSKLMENGEGHLQSPPMFRSGFGKSVMVKQSSITKALSILDDEDDAFADIGQLCNGNDSGCSFSNSMFQTGSGKKVNISSTGLVRAKTLLGLERGHDNGNFPVLERSKNQSTSGEPFGWQNPSHSETREGANTTCYKDATAPLIPLFDFKDSSSGSDSKGQDIPDLMHAAAKCPPIKFHTAGGRSISVSSDALQRAKSLLGDMDLGTFLNEGDMNTQSFSFFEQGRLSDNQSDKENNPFSTFCHQEITKSNRGSKNFVSPLRSDSNQLHSSFTLENVILVNNLISKFDAEDYDNTSMKPNNSLCQKKIQSIRPSSNVVVGNSLENGVCSRINPRRRSLDGPLVDISNKIGMAHVGTKLATGEKRRIGRSSISPFKRPRSSRFIAPLNITKPAPSGLSTAASEHSRQRVSMRYPFQVPRTYVKEYFGTPPCHLNVLKQLPDHIRRMNPENAEKYMFPDTSGVDCIGAEAFYHLLAQSGASSMQYASKEWVANHYKWIVWKLACYERCYPSKSSGKLLTVSNVLEELKYRYEREVNHGHRSAIKRILEGDQPPSSMFVLCISSIQSNCDRKIENLPIPSNDAENGTAAKVELTDGWYSINALLDVLLLKKLATGKLFVGQKLRIWGAGLCGWVGPISPLEASSTVGLLLHINGTYRAHWADRLGLCKGGGAPLALRCVKAMGGPIPCTIVGITRIYPVLFRERLSNGRFIVRSERMEAKTIQSYNQRRSSIAEGIISEFQRGIKKFHANNDNDSEEGAKILKILETAAEPEVLMAEMTSEQLTSFTTYQAKIEAIRQSDMQKSIDKALGDAGLTAREVTPFMRVRVVGLTYKNYSMKCYPGKGLITIWSPTEKLQLELVEGKVYGVAGLIPSSSESDTLYLQASGSTTKWAPLSPSATDNFESFFTPRKSVLLSHLGEVPLSNEFDIAALVVYVGEVYTDSHRKKQWVFVTDGSIADLNSEEPLNSLLAISFYSPYVDCDSFAPINHNLVGSVICFCNLIKRAKDQKNQIWAAETTENSTYFISCDHGHCSHLREAAASAERWAKISSSAIEKLKQKVLFIVGNGEG